MNTTKNKFLNRQIISSSASVVISLSLVLFVIGLLGLLIINAQKVSNYLKENIGLTIMLKENITEIEITKFQKILDASYFVKTSEFVSKEKATIDLQNELGEDFVKFLGYSPLLASIDVKINSPQINARTYAGGTGLNTQYTGYLAQSASGGGTKVATVVNAVQFLFNSGNITSGTITMYGLVNS